MSLNHLVYPLNDGYIHNWLVAGPLATPVSGSEGVNPEDCKGVELWDRLQITRQFFREQSVISGPPVDRGASEINGEKIGWNYFRCQDDHLVDVSKVVSGRQHLHTWAYTEIKSQSPLNITFILTTPGPAAIWLNGALIHRQENFNAAAISTPVQASLAAENTLLVCFEQVALRDCVATMALRIVGLPAKDDETALSISIPTNARYPLRHKALEQILEHAYLEEVVNHRGANFNLRWAEDLKQEITYAHKILDAQNLNYAEGNWKTNPVEPHDIGHTFRLRERPYWVTLTAPIKEYFEQNLRYQRQLPIHVLDEAYSSVPYKTLPQRRQEALESAAKFEDHLFAEIAKMELNQWSDVNAKPILKSIDQVNRGEDGSEVLLAGLLGMLVRFQDNPSFPEKLKGPIEDCALNFKYGLEEAGQETRGQETRGKSPLDFTAEGYGESRAILFHTCEVLAGQLYPKHTFTAAGKSGLAHRRKGNQLALDWIRQRCSMGFADWNSNSEVERVILALSYLTSLAKNDALHELSAVLLDKILFTLAYNSFKGAYGCSHGRTQASMVKSAQLEATSGVSRMLWGMGVSNHHILGTVGLACSDYAYPAFFAGIAADLPEEMWSKERHLNDVNTVTYKTPDFMLSSAQDYRPGERGSQEHIWQATLGPDAMAFTSHPACMSENEAHRPGFWLGNAVLPRVAQWKDALIAVYNLPEQDWMGFTHAFFPTFAFDDHAFAGRWAFARKKKGYLALTAARGFELVKRGPDGYRELRSYGRQNIWICQMGREALDGSFANFRNKVTGLPVSFQDLAVQMTGLRGESLAFGWSGPLLLNGIEQPITGFKHIENPYCSADLPAKYLDISRGEDLLRLNFD